MSAKRPAAPKPFTFVGHRFDFRRGRASFYYRSPSGRRFTEKINFDCPADAVTRVDRRILNRALDLALFLIGTSYYKADPTTTITSKRPISPKLAKLLNATYQDGLSQFAFENHLTREQLAHFAPTGDQSYWRPLAYAGQGILALQSGGKDSLLVATELTEAKLPFRPAYVTSSPAHPAVLDQLGKPLTPIHRELDRKNLQKAGGLTGHVPITYIIHALALVQAVLYGYNRIAGGIGDEGEEPHAVIVGPAEPPLSVRHQWSKTTTAEALLEDFIKTEISPAFEIRSPLRGRSELQIAADFSAKCWDKYGHLFSSCNVANYAQGHHNQDLKWCGHCAKCANAYLLFAPHIPAAELNDLIAGGRDLFADPAMTEIFKGLLGIDEVMKPFECVGSVKELREAYANRRSDYGQLPFAVPKEAN